ncbi:IGHM protein, partial [Edolisoma coerulescens]|nr:IGHM protein [Edolisoma coerulescens]
TFLAASRLGMPLEEGKSRQPFRCRAEHPRGVRSVLVSNPGPGALIPMVPVVTLHPPSREDFQGPYRNSTLLCQIRGPRRPPGAAPIRWLKNGTPLREGVTPEALASEGSGLFVTGSRVVVTEAEWDRGDVFTCQADEEMRNTSKAMECG